MSTGRGLALDAEIERLVLQAFEPDRVALAVSALEQLECEAAMLERQWKMRIERARYEATRAQRQYEMCEPENRLVARNLERLWETKLRTVEEAEQEFEAWRRQNGTVLTDEDRRQILALGEDLPKLWAAPTTTNADRKQIIRLIIKDVVWIRNVSVGNYGSRSIGRPARQPNTGSNGEQQAIGSKLILSSCKLESER